MKISIKKIYCGNYKEVTIEETNTHINTGLLDRDEQLELAREFLEAAYDLIEDHDDWCNKIQAVIEEM